MSRIHRMSRGRKTLLTLLLVGAIGTVAGVGTFSAFSATTVNPGNSFAAGTVVISDNDANAAMYTIANAAPTVAVMRCIRVTYTGTLPSTVKLYASTAIGAIGPFVDLVIDKGTMPVATAFPNCTGFVADAGGSIFTNTLGNFGTTRTNFVNGVQAFPGVQTAWNQNDTLVYRFTLTLQNNAAATGLTSGLHDFTWEAQNQ